MKSLGFVATVSLVGLMASIVAYSFVPLPSSWGFGSLGNPTLWLSVAILAIALVCFLALLISGLTIVLNWGADGPRGRNRGG